MTVTNTLRFLLKKFSSGGDPHPTREEHNAMIDSIENNAAMGSQGITSARPAAGKGLRFFWDETVKRMWYDDGANWQDLNPNGGGGAGTTIVPGAAAAEGASARAARADHTHALPLATSGAHGAMSATDKAKLDGSTAAATANALALRDANGRVSVGTPTTATHAATMAYVDGALVQAADYADAKVNAGQAPVSLAPLAISGYTVTGKIYTENAGPKKRITVDVNVAKTGADDTITSTFPFKTLGTLLPASARGTGSDSKYVPVAISGGANNVHATVYLSPFSGLLQIRAQTAFTIQSGATFSLTIPPYFVDAA